MNMSGSLLAQQCSSYQCLFFPLSPRIHVGWSRSIASKLTWILILLLLQGCYRTVEQFLSYVQHIRQKSISKRLNYYSYSKKNLLLNQSIWKGNVRQLLLKAAILCTNVFVPQTTIICFFMDSRNTASVTFMSVIVPRS